MSRDRRITVPVFVILTLLCVFSLLTCSSDDDDDVVWNPPPAAMDWNRDILDTALVVDMTALTGKATIVLAESSSTAASFEAGGLVIDAVSTVEGPLNYTLSDGRLDIGVPATSGDVSMTIDYRFIVQDNFNGYLETGVTLIWPYFCGNLFPCHSDPADGTTFSLSVLNVPDLMRAIYPQTIPTSAPSYQIAWAIGEYNHIDLGTTPAGTDIGVWILPGMENKYAGWQHLAAVFEWFEKTIGSYSFGDQAGTIGVVWGPGGFGGMEHHPFWHISKPALGMADVHTHEAGHGWFGDGVRIECWEDFVLSEGTVTYLTARATGQAIGPAEEAAIWEDYEDDLAWILSHDDGIAWFETCGEVDILEDGLFSLVPYIKGAYFYRAVANEIGVDTLDNVLHTFYVNRVGTAARMQDMLDHILTETGFDATELAEGWLKSYGCPDETLKQRIMAKPLLEKPVPLDMRTFTRYTAE